MCCIYQAPFSIYHQGICALTSYPTVLCYQLTLERKSLQNQLFPSRFAPFLKQLLQFIGYSPILGVAKLIRSCANVNCSILIISIHHVAIPTPLSLEAKKAGHNAPHIFNSPGPDSAELLAVYLLINNFTWFSIATRAKNSHFHLCH